MRQWNKTPKMTLTECIRVNVHRKGTKAREFRLCAVGGAGHGAQLQVLTPGDGSKTLIVGDVNKACRLGWPLITYEKDYSPEAIASIRALHGARKRKRNGLGFIWPFKKKAKRRVGDKTVYFVPTKSGGYVSKLHGARRKRRRR